MGSDAGELIAARGRSEPLAPQFGWPHPRTCRPSCAPPLCLRRSGRVAQREAEQTRLQQRRVDSQPSKKLCEANKCSLCLLTHNLEESHPRPGAGTTRVAERGATDGALSRASRYVATCNMAAAQATRGQALASTFTLVQHHGGNYSTALTRHNQRWCHQSSCCRRYVMYTGQKFEDLLRGEQGDGGQPIPTSWAKILTIRRELSSSAEAVVYIDADAFLRDACWCPIFAPGVSMLISGDPPRPSWATGGWTARFNGGFFAVKANHDGRQLMASWWHWWARRKADWAGAGRCGGCMAEANANSACPIECKFGGRLTDQGSFDSHVLPKNSHHIRELPKGFQALPDRTVGCAGTVVHSAAGAGAGDAEWSLRACARLGHERNCVGV